jgi:hypothetical protein
MSHITITGAYGRDYTTAEKAKADWNKDLDFTVHTPGLGGKYVNKQQAKHMKADGFEFVRIRFNKKAEHVDVQL